MPRGPKPKPAEEHRRNGNPGGRPGRDQATIVGGRGAPAKPDALLADDSVLGRLSSQAWDELVDVMSPAGVLDRADGALLEHAATVIGLYRLARVELAADSGGTLTAAGQKGSPVAHPMVGVIFKAGSELRQLFDLLGIGPVGRARLGIAGEGGADPAKAADAIVGEAGRTRLRAVETGDGGAA